MVKRTVQTWFQTDRVSAKPYRCSGSEHRFQPVRSCASMLYSKRMVIICLPMSALWTEMKERSEVTRDGNSRVAKRLNTPTLPLPLLWLVGFGCIVCQPAYLRRKGPTAWGLNGPPQSYGRNISCISTFRGEYRLPTAAGCATFLPSKIKEFEMAGRRTSGTNLTK